MTPLQECPGCGARIGVGARCLNCHPRAVDAVVAPLPAREPVAAGYWCLRIAGWVVTALLFILAGLMVYAFLEERMPGMLPSILETLACGCAVLWITDSFSKSEAGLLRRASSGVELTAARGSLLWIGPPWVVAVLLPFFNFAVYQELMGVWSMVQTVLLSISLFIMGFVMADLRQFFHRQQQLARDANPGAQVIRAWPLPLTTAAAGLSLMLTQFLRDSHLFRPNVGIGEHAFVGVVTMALALIGWEAERSAALWLAAGAKPAPLPLVPKLMIVALLYSWLTFQFLPSRDFVTMSYQPGPKAILDSVLFACLTLVPVLFAVRAMQVLHGLCSALPHAPSPMQPARWQIGVLVAGTAATLLHLVVLGDEYVLWIEVFRIGMLRWMLTQNEQLPFWVAYLIVVHFPACLLFYVSARVLLARAAVTSKPGADA